MYVKIGTGKFLNEKGVGSTDNSLSFIYFNK